MRKLFLAAFALSMPAVVGAQNAPAEKQPDWIEQAKIVAEMDGVSVGEAVRRGNLERRLAHLAEKLSKDPYYGGSEILRSKNRYEIVHYFTNDTSSSGDSEIDRASSFRTVNFSMKEMQDFQRLLSPRLSSVDAKAYISIRPSENRVRIYTTNPEGVRSIILELGPIPEFVDIVSGGWFSSNDAAMMGGGAISGTSGSCTAAFNVKGSVTGVSTASHCVPFNLQSYQGVSIGTHRGPAYVKNATDRAGRDFTWYRNNNHTYNNAVKYGSSFYSITTVAAANVSPNTSACLIKQNGSQVCAWVYEVATPPGGTYSAVILDRSVAVKGDSGGPWLYGSIAYGVHQGTKCDDPALTINCKSLYSPAAHMPAVLGVSVITQ